MPKKFYKREWLNPKEGTAFIESCVEPNYSGVYSYVNIADCSRKVSIEFSYEKKDYKARIAKVDKMIKALTDLKQSLIEHHELVK